LEALRNASCLVFDSVAHRKVMLVLARDVITLLPLVESELPVGSRRRLVRVEDVV